MFEVGIVCVIFVDVYVVGGYVYYCIGFVVQYFGGGEVGEDCYVQCFGLLGQLMGYFIQVDDVVVFVVEVFWQQCVGCVVCVVWVEEQEFVVGDFLFQWCVVFGLVGEQFGQCVGIYDCIGQNVCVGFGVFFQYVYGQFVFGFDGMLVQLDCGGQVSGVGVDDYYVEFYGFMWGQGGGFFVYWGV